MRALIAYGSTSGGTAGLAEMVAAGLRRRGIDATAVNAAGVRSLDGVDAVVIGGALYANRWHRDARRLVRRRRAELAARPVWLFSSGPLSAEATERDIPPVPQVRRAARRIGARGHVTFGGRLAAGSTGFGRRSMARTMAGDWRDPAQVDRWAGEIADALVGAVPVASGPG